LSYILFVVFLYNEVVRIK